MFTPEAVRALQAGATQHAVPSATLELAWRRREAPSGLKGSGARLRPILQRPCTAWVQITALKPMP